MSPFESTTTAESGMSDINALSNSAEMARASSDEASSSRLLGTFVASSSLNGCPSRDHLVSRFDVQGIGARLTQVLFEPSSVFSSLKDLA
jgi:hypothetical protein